MDKKVVLISGVSSGIGLELAKKFINNNYIVYGVGRRDFSLSGLHYIKKDITKEESIIEIIDLIVKREKQIDIFINNAGMGISGPVEYTKKADIENIFNVNLHSAVFFIQNILPVMRKQQHGKIIFVSSVASDISIPFQVFYSVTKSGIDKLAEGLRSEVHSFNIQICTVNPGDTATAFTAVREKQILKENNPYFKNNNNSIKQMERDEQNGMKASYVANKIYKCAIKKKMPLKKIIGIKYKLICFLINCMPKRMREWCVRKIYF